MTDEDYRRSVRDRILGRSVELASGCIEYGGVENLKHPYGLVSLTFGNEGGFTKRRSVPAHRALWMAVHDKFDLPSCVQIRHSCDNPRCVNENHLVEGAARDNMRDCVERGRRATKYRLHTRLRVYDDDKVRAIRSAEGTTISIAAKFGVSAGYVSKLKTGKLKSLVA